MSFEESTFIETVEQFPCIWDIKNKDHKNKIKLEAAWTSISHIFEDTVENCQENWKSIRGKYVRERKFVKEMPSGSGSYSGTWPNFEKLGFLASNVQIRRTKGNLLLGKRKVEDVAGPSKVWRETEESLLMSPVSTPESESLRTTPTELDTEQGTDQLSSTGQAEASTPTAQGPPARVRPTPGSLRREKCTNKKKTELNKIVETVTTVGESLGTLLRQQQSSRVEELNQSDYHFALSLAESLADVKDPKQKLLLKARLLTIVAEAVNP